MKTWFDSAEESHAHSLRTLEILQEYDDFMESISTLADMGCGSAGLDLEWWATRTTSDGESRSLNIQCTGVDQIARVDSVKKYRNIRYLRQDFEQPIMVSDKKFDVLWCHDSFQFVIDPFRTLSQWREVADQDAMLVLIVPQTTNIEFNQQDFTQRDGCYWNWTMVSLIHVLAVTGWDCASGFFYKDPQDPWLHAVVYNNGDTAYDPRTTRWYDLAEQGRLPVSARQSVERHGYLRQQDLVLPWLDKSIHSMGRH